MCLGSVWVTCVSGRGVASGGEKVAGCIGPRGLGGPAIAYWPFPSSSGPIAEIRIRHSTAPHFFHDS